MIILAQGFQTEKCQDAIYISKITLQHGEVRAGRRAGVGSPGAGKLVLAGTWLVVETEWRVPAMCVGSSIKGNWQSLMTGGAAEVGIKAIPGFMSNQMDGHSIYSDGKKHLLRS